MTWNVGLVFQLGGGSPLHFPAEREREGREGTYSWRGLEMSQYLLSSNYDDG